MKNKKYLLLITIPLLLTSCSNKNSNAFYVMKDLSNTGSYYDLNADQVLNKINYDNFILYLGTDTCSTCAKVSEELKTYIKSTNTLMYRYSNNDKEYEKLHKAYPKIFTEDFLTPQILVFTTADGLVYQTNDYTKMEGKSLTKLLDGYSLNNKFVTFTNEFGFNEFKNIKENSMLVTYSSLDSKTEMFKSAIPYEALKSVNKYVAFIDLALLDNGLKTTIETYYQVSDITNKMLQTSNKGKILDYVESGIDPVNKFIEDFKNN